MTFIKECSLQADPHQVRTASFWLDSICHSQGVPTPLASRLDLCLNEILANIIAHGGDAARLHPINIKTEIEHTPDKWDISVTVSDAGVAFDPTSVQEKPTPKTLAEAVPGGLGLIMIRSNADRLSYAFVGGRNQLKFSVCADHHT